MIYSDGREPEPIVLSHRPLRRTRTEFTGECMFAASWMRFMDSPLVEDDYNPRGYSTKLELILSTYPHQISQTTATIAASFITWLGTNGGLHFLNEARKMMVKVGNPADGFLAAWAIENRRTVSINSGVRTIEAILSKDDHGQTQDLFWERRPYAPLLSAAEVEVVEHLVEWLSCEEGMAFVSKCETEISNLREATQDEKFEQMMRERRQNNKNGETSYAP